MKRALLVVFVICGCDFDKVHDDRVAQLGDAGGSTGGGDAQTGGGGGGAIGGGGGAIGGGGALGGGGGALGGGGGGAVGGGGGGATGGGGGGGGGAVDAGCPDDFCLVSSYRIIATSESGCSAARYGSLSDIEVFCGVDYPRKRVRFNGTSWSPSNISIPGNGLLHSDGRAGDFWLTDNQNVLHDNGSSVTVEDCGGSPVVGYQVWSPAPREAWAATDGPAVCHYFVDGGSTLVPIPGHTGSISSVWTHQSDFVVGVYNQLLSLDGGVLFEDPNISDVSTIHALTPNDVWAGTEAGWVLHRDSTGSWASLSHPSGWVHDVRVVLANEVWVSAHIVRQRITDAGVDSPPLSMAPELTYGVRGGADGIVVFGESVNGTNSQHLDGVMSVYRRRGF